MRILTVPNWSFGRGPSLLGSLKEAMAWAEVSVHYAASDYDHNRTVTAFSGTPAALEDALIRMAELVFGWVDLRGHDGVHPRVGALDVCPIVALDPDDLLEAKALA